MWTVGERKRRKTERATEESDELKQCITKHVHINGITKPIIVCNNLINNDSRNKKMEEQKDSQGRESGSERLWGKGLQGKLIKVSYTYL